MSNSISSALIAAAKSLRDEVNVLQFQPPVSFVYSPLDYAWAAHEKYLRRYANSRKRVLFLGMNPGPFGMVQTGIPFGQVAAVRDWLDLETRVTPPARQHPKRPVTGFACQRSEVSGERLWGLFARRFGTAGRFFRDHFVANYCPLAFVEVTGRNRTPDKLLPGERELLFQYCDAHLREIVRILQPQWLIGIGDFATKRSRQLFVSDKQIKVGGILHPSPACPASNVDWPGKVTAQLTRLGVWD